MGGRGFPEIMTLPFEQKSFWTSSEPCRAHLLQQVSDFPRFTLFVLNRPCSNYPAVLHISSITSASNGCRYSTQSVSHSSTFGPCNMFQYGLPWHIFYIQLLTPFYLCVQLSHAVIGYFITSSPSGIMHRMALQHCSQTSFPSTADSHHVDTSHWPLCLLPAVRWLLPHSWEPLPRSTVKRESKTPLALGGCLKKVEMSVPGWKAVICPIRAQSNRKLQPGQETEYAWAIPACHVDSHQGTPSPRQPSRLVRPNSSSGMTMQSDRPLPCGVFPRGLSFLMQSINSTTDVTEITKPTKSKIFPASCQW